MISLQQGYIPPPTPEFEPGDIVYHKRYGYRGVIVDSDVSCQASPQWLASNLTQPSPSQPWYHVLVHSENHTTYVAEENLTEDASGDPITHPLVNHFFSSYSDDGYYIRNETPWDDDFWNQNFYQAEN